MNQLKSGFVCACTYIILYAYKVKNIWTFATLKIIAMFCYSYPMCIMKVLVLYLSTFDLYLTKLWLQL